MAEEGFKLPGSSYDQLVKIIKAYGSIDRPASPKDVGDLAGVDQTTVSRNNGFLLAVGIVEGGRQKGITTVGASLARALEHEMPVEIQRWWREVVDSADFLQRVVSAVRVRNGMDAPTLQGHIAYTAGQKRTPTAMAGASAVVDVLRASGRLVDRDGKFVVGDDRAPELSEGPGLDVAPAQSSMSVAPRRQVAHGRGVSMVVEFRINVECSFEDLPGIGERLAAVLKSLEDAAEEDHESASAD